MTDARTSSPSTARNREPILAVMQAHFPAQGRVLEIASGAGEPFERFFGPNPRAPQQRVPRQRSLGSGFIIATDGEILTNNHVVGDANDIVVIFTDGRKWPTEIEPSYAGYSIGRWIDEDGGGRYDVLEVETRGPFKGPRAYDATGLPLHFDNQSIFKERIYRDKADPNILHDEITTFDHALTRPWTVDKKYVRNPDPLANWPEYYISEGNGQIMIDKENYFLRDRKSTRLNSSHT